MSDNSNDAIDAPHVSLFGLASGRRAGGGRGRMVAGTTGYAGCLLPAVREPA